MCFPPPRAALCALLALAAVPAADGADPPPAPGRQYVLRTWETDDGLPHNVVNAILKRRDGFIWVATQARTVRFDGLEFTILRAPAIDPPRPTSVRALAEEDARTLLLANDAAGLLRVSGAEVAVHPVASQFAGRRVMALFRERDDVFWMAFYGREVWRWNQGAVEKFPAPPGVSSDVGVSFGRGSDGAVCVSRGAGIELYRDGALAPLAGAPGPVTLGSSDRGGAWVATPEALYRLEAGKLAPVSPAVPWRDPAPPNVLKESADGALWVGLADHGLWRWTPEGAARIETSFPRINAIEEDDEDGIWVGTAGGGLDRLQRTRFSLLTEGRDWVTGAAVSVCEGAPGELWYADRNRLYRARGGRFQALDGPGWPAHPLPVCRDGGGNVWIASDDRLFLVRAGSEGPPLAAGRGGPGHVHALFAARDGSVWVGRDQGPIERFRGTTPEPADRLGAAAGYDEADTVHAIGEDAGGHVWIGTLAGALYDWDGRRLRRYGRADGLPGGDIRTLWGDAEGSLWIGTAGTGMVVVRDGRLLRLGPAQGLPDSTVSQILEDRFGSLWLGTSRFLFRAQKRDLLECAEGRRPSFASFAYGRADGIAGFTAIGSYQPTALRADSGRLWFATRKGLVTTDPAEHRREIPAPRAHLDRFSVDGRALPPIGARLVSANRRYEFRYTAPSYASPRDVRYRYRLDGLDADWSEATAERAATYSGLPPGRYRFRVTASAGGLRWNPDEAAAAFEVLPAWWETWWARAAALALAAGGLGTLVRYVTHRRLRDRLERLEWRQRAEAERDRIARDLHDGLGASLTQASMMAEEMCEDTDNVPDLKAQAGRLLEKVRTIARDLEGAVWAASPQHDTLASLGDYLSRFSLEYFRNTGIRCQVDASAGLPPRPLPPDARHHLFMIAQESMNNALKHSRAGRVELAMRMEGEEFVLSVADDGRGFDPAAAAASGRSGLRNIRARAQAAGGRVEIESSARGTVVRVRLPGDAGVPSP